jgi:hypothetical protein
MTIKPPNYQQPQQQNQPWSTRGSTGWMGQGGGAGTQRPGGWTTAPNPGSYGNPTGPQVPMRGLGPNVEGQIQQFKDQRGNLRNLINQYSDPMAMQRGIMGGVMGQMGGWERAPLPNDQYANQYMQHLIGGQKQGVMDLAKNLRQSNVRGMRVAGGSDPYSQAVKDAYGTLASGYSDRYGQSMDYARGRVQDDNAQRQFLANLGLQGSQAQMSALTDMLGLQKDYSFADEDRRRRDQEWQDYMAERARRWKTEDVDRSWELNQRQQEQDYNQIARRYYNAWAGKGPNEATQLANWLQGPPQQMGNLGWSGLPSYMTGA